MDILSGNKKKSTSPKTKKQIELKEIELKVNEIDFEHNNLYRCCCNKKTDKRILEYFAKTTISFSVLIFSFYQISVIDDPCNNMMSFYTGLVSLIIGTFIKTPDIKSKT